ncbi:MAG: hypothetical protein ACRDKI_03265 [Solirubrobacterales bacterium]
MSGPKPVLVLPGWWKSPSGLILPSSVARLPSPAAEFGGLPDGVSVPLLPVIVGDVLPNDLDQMLIFVDEQSLGFAESTLDSAKTNASNLPFEASVKQLAYVSAKVTAIHRSPDRQRAFADETFADPYRSKAQAFMKAHKNAELFGPQQVSVVLRLVIERASTGENDLPGDQLQFELARLMVGAGQLVHLSTDDLKLDADGKMDSWLTFFLRNGAFHGSDSPLGEMTRAVAIFEDIARSDEIRAHRDFCDLDAWMESEYGLSIEEQLALGFGLSAMTASWDEGELAGTNHVVSAENFKDLVEKLGMLDRLERATAVVSASREEFRQEYSELGDGLDAIVWDIRPLNKHPFLRLDSGDLVLMSPRSLQVWLTDGFHYRALDAAKRLGASDSQRYTRFAGLLLERYFRELMDTSLGDREIGLGKVFGEQLYRSSSGESLTSDLALDFGTDLVLIEISASRLRASTLVSGNEDDIAKDLDRMLIRKAKQVFRCAADLEAGVALIPADSPEIDMNRIERIWPIVLTAGSIFQQGVLHQRLEKELSEARAASTPKLQPLVILDPADMELIVGLMEKGEHFPDLLTSKTQPGYRERELAKWLQHDPNAPGPAARPKEIERRWGEATDRIEEMIDMTKGIQSNTGD